MDLETTGTTEIGSYFVSNYPPFSLWKQEYVAKINEVLHQSPESKVPMGLYIHIPFCRKRCKFCYFRVYEKQNAKTIERYVQALEREFELLSKVEVIQDRTLDFTYFGGGTPSYLSSKQLLSLRDRLSSLLSWETAQEVTFECEPGTLNLEKVKTLKEIGITRISLGVESFNDTLLEANGRAHLSPEVFKAYDWIQEVGFPQVNIDLIAGMMGETDDNWTEAVEKASEMDADNITIYQMELPHNTIISKEIKEMGITSPIANWATKRRWMNEAIETLQTKGYHLASGNELVKNPETDRFVYRDNLFRGNDIIATGVSSFGHLQGVHYQNLDRLEDYLESMEKGELPINRALEPSEHQRLIREFVLQLKEGRVLTQPFYDKFGVKITEEFSKALDNQQKAGYLTYDDTQVQLTRKGLLQADSLLTEYFEPEHRMVRYT